MVSVSSTSSGDSRRDHIVYLIRHAQPANVQDAGLRYDVPPGPPLSAAGRAQAAMAAHFIQSAPPLVVYTSPLERAVQTAQIIAAQLDVPLAIDERLAEQRREESGEQVVARTANFWYERAEIASLRCIALVSHGSPIRAMLTLLGDVMIASLAHYRFDRGNIAPHAGIWRARCATTDPTGRWELALIFRTISAGATPTPARPPAAS